MESRGPEFIPQNEELKQVGPPTAELKSIVPRVDKGTGVYVDENGEEWAVANTLAQRNEVDIGFIRRYAAKGSTRSLEGQDAFGRATILYNIGDLQKQINEWRELPQVDKETGVYTNEEGNRWVPLAFLAKKYNIAYTALKRNLAEVTNIVGRDISGNRGQLYNLEQSEEKLEPFLTRPRVDKETGIYTDEEGRTWGSLHYFYRKYNLDFRYLQGLLSALPQLGGIDASGKLRQLYSIQETEKKIENESYARLPLVDNETGIYTDPDGEEWASQNSFLTDEVGPSALGAMLNGVRSVEGRDRNGQVTQLYNRHELADRINEFVSLPKVDNETEIYTDAQNQEWISISSLSRQLNVGLDRVKVAAANATRLPGRDKSGRRMTLVNKAETERMLAPLTSLPQVDRETGVYIDEEGIEWVAREILVGEDVKKYKLNTLLSDVPFIPGRGPRGIETILYKKTEAEEAMRGFIALPLVDYKEGIHRDEQGNEWLTKEYLVRQGISEYLVSQLLDEVPSLDGRDNRGHRITLYNRIEAEKKVEEFLSLPQVDKETGIYIDKQNIEWVAQSFFVNKGINHKILSPILVGMSTLKGRNIANRITDLFPREEVEDRLQKSGYYKRIEEWKAIREDNDRQKALDQFSAELREGATIDAQQFRGLVGLFGASRVVDILFRYRSEYQGIPIEHVKSVIADYLGEFLVTKTTFNPPDLEQGISFLGEPNFREGLYEVIKSSCLDYYNLYKKQSPDLSDEIIIQTYLTYVRTETARFANDDLNQILDSIDTYFQFLLLDTDKPDRIIDELKEGRQFPDLYQRINIKEIADKQRMLIADEMGVGKSASVILAKERLGIKQALIMAPSNVINTWRGYLSDEKHEDGKQIGYFKAGQAPNIYVVDEETFKNGSVDLSQYEYILISHERLTDENRQYIDHLTPDMTIIDEVHKLKNVREGKRSSHALEIAEKIDGEGKYCALLSGTPVPNKVEDIAISLKLLYPEQFKDVPSRQMVSDILSADILDLRQLLLPRMQMKSLAESVDMPPLHEHLIEVELSENEKEMYEVLVEEDELEAHEKIRLLRQFLLNPAMLETFPVIEGAKFKAAEQTLLDAFETNNKVALFVNGYIQEILRGEHAILDSFRLPEEVEVRIIDGKTPVPIRDTMQREFNASDKKILLAVSGQTADVGVDYSPAEALAFYNEPWTKYDLRQQRGRVYRPGLQHPLNESIFVVKGTLEEGIHHYIEAKERAIEKLLRGIPITDLEREMLKHAEEQSASNVEVNPELARYYYSSWERLMRIFNHVREIGEENFQKFLAEHAADYAESYQDLGSRSYQANANRIIGSLINSMVQQQQQDIQNTIILDVASGPEMLKQHIPDAYQDRVFSLDLNMHHFQNREGPKAVVGSFTNLPIREKSVDFTNLNLALHYTQFIPSRGNYERLRVLTEMNRVLKEGGKAVVNLIYSMDIRDWDKFEEIVRVLGFEINGEYSGIVQQGDNYRSHVLTLEKHADIDLTFDELKELLKDDFDGLKFKRIKSNLKDSRRIITKFNLGETEIPIHFNNHDQKIWEEEQAIITEGEGLRDAHTAIADIPPEQILDHGFIRFYNGKRYVLFKRLESGQGYVVIK